MKILIADDDPISRRLLEVTLPKWDYEPIVACDGDSAWKVLEHADAPRLAILDWMMPGMDGVEVCRRTRALQRRTPTYLILLTALAGKDNLVTGLDSGADDYIAKPVHTEELRARLRAAGRIVDLQAALAARIQELEVALGQVKQLQGLIPICAWCKRIRDDKDYWQQLEAYLTAHTDAIFTHGICPDCYVRMIQEAAKYPRQESNL